MNYVPRCETCWRLAVTKTRLTEAMGHPRPRCFDVYLRTYRRNHTERPGPMKHDDIGPLEVAAFGGAL